MERVEVQQQRVGPGRVDVEPGDLQTPRATPVAQRQQYTETSVNPSWGRRLTGVVWLVAGILDAILAFDFLFRALSGANTGFANFIYNLGARLGAPFDGIFGNTINNAGNGTIGIDRWGDLMAIAIYTLVALALTTLLRVTTAPGNSVSKNSTTVM